MGFESLILVVVAIVINLLIMYAVVKAAIVNALRQARHEERVELMEPDGIRWFTQRERDIVRRTRAGELSGPATKN